MRRKLISHSPEEVNLNNLDLLDKCLKKFLKNQSLRSRPWLIAFVYLFIYFFNKSRKKKNNLQRVKIDSTA